MSNFIFIPGFDADVFAQQINSWKTTHPEAGLVAMIPEARHDHIGELQDLCRGLKVPLVGAVFPLLLADGQFQTDGVVLVCFEKMPPFYLEENLPQEETELEQRVQNMAGRISSQTDDEDNTTLLVIFDAMLPHISTILEKLYLHLADSVQYMGANAGSETFQPMPCLFNNHEIIENGVLALLLSPHTGAALEHGYCAPEHLIAATSTAGNRIISINWRPAFDVYRERIREQYAVDVTSDNFYQYAVHFPFGIMRADGEVLVRIPVALAEDNSLFCVGEVPENAILTLLDAPEAKSLHTVEQLLKQCDDSDRDILTFYCAGRRMHLGESANSELELLQEQMGNRSLYGALSLGEIGSSRKGGYPLFHNASLVCATI
ncbi:MAG TPA: histidine kinase [Gammaproteobacteria bacterium]|nr:histidine kinase [Gammaproteobacteria bacterium]